VDNVSSRTIGLALTGPTAYFYATLKRLVPTGTISGENFSNSHCVLSHIFFLNAAALFSVRIPAIFTASREKIITRKTGLTTHFPTWTFN